MAVSEGPFDVGQRQAVYDRRIIIHIIIIVVINKLVPECLAENHEYRHRQKDTDAGYRPFAV
jgi:hypothetical protein